VEQLEALFGGRLYIELSRRGDATEMAAEKALIDLAYARALPIVATNPANFVEPNFHAAHDAMLCIAQSAYVESEDRRVSSREAWLKPAEAMEDADRKSTRLNSSHVKISYAVFCLKKKKL